VTLNDRDPNKIMGTAARATTRLSGSLCSNCPGQSFTFGNITY